MTLEEHKLVVGRNLLYYRTEKRYTQETVAEMADISPTHYAALESGKKNMSSFILKKLCDALDVSSDVLLSEPYKAEQGYNINFLLKDKSPEFIYSVERAVRLLVAEFDN